MGAWRHLQRADRHALHRCTIAACPTSPPCPRVRFNQPQPFQKVGDSIPTGTPTFKYITFPTYYLPNTKGNNTIRNTAAYGTYTDPKVGYSDLPTIVNGDDTFPGCRPSTPSAVPAVCTFNADVNKNIKFTGPFTACSSRAELYNALNHANSYLVLSGANDVSTPPTPRFRKTVPARETTASCSSPASASS